MKQRLSLILLCLLLPARALYSVELPWLGATNQKGDFVQEKHLAALSRPFITKGQYTYQPQTGLTWHTQYPVNNQLLINQHGVIEIQAGGSEKLLTSDTSFSQLLLPIFSADQQQLHLQFDISETEYGLLLTPLSPQITNVIKSLELHIADNQIRQININEANGNLTNIFLHINNQSPKVE